MFKCNAFMMLAYLVNDAFWLALWLGYDLVGNNVAWRTQNEGGLTFCIYREVKDFYVQASGAN
jgi:hypothetical protein